MAVDLAERDHLRTQTASRIVLIAVVDLAERDNLRTREGLRNEAIVVDLAERDHLRILEMLAST